MRSDDDALVTDVWREIRGDQLDLVHQLVVDVAELRVPVDLDRWGRVRVTAHRLAGTLSSLHLQPAGDTAVALDDVTGGVDVPEHGLLLRVRDLTAALHAAVPHTDAECTAAPS